MNRAILACALALFSLGAARTALAQSDPYLVLVSGSDVITWNGNNLSCSTDGGVTVTAGCTTATETTWGISTSGTNTATGTYVLTASDFDGWVLTGNTGQTLSPNCTAAGCMSQNEIDITGGTSNLTAYFGSAAFDHQDAVVDTQEVSNASETFTSEGLYNSSGMSLMNLGYANGTPPDLSGWSAIGSTMTLNTCTGLGCVTDGQATSSALPGGKFALTDELTFTAGGDYAVTDTITAVPEPASLILLGSALLGASIIVRRKTQSKRA